jgi:hypothetical protein
LILGNSESFAWKITGFWQWIGLPIIAALVLSQEMDASLCATEFPGVRFRTASVESAAKFS